MKRIALLLLLTLSLPLTLRADDSSRRDKAKELLILLHTDRLLQQIMDGMKQQVGTMAKPTVGSSMTPAQQARISDFQQQLFTLIESQMSYKSMEPDYIKLYADNFTDEELDALLVFYRSPAGQSMVEKLPALTAQSFQLAQARVTAILPQIQQMAQDFAKSCTECIRPPVIGGVAGMGNPHPPVQNAQSGVAFSAQAQRIPAGVMSGNLLDRVNPVYPPIAKAAHVQGMVILHALISKDGHIENIAAISGPPMLISSAEDAVKRWVYKPYLLNGEPTEVETTINVNFTFGPPQPAASSVPAGSTPPPDDPQTTNDVAPH